MKKLLTLFLLIPFYFLSQNTKELDSSSAINIYYSTSKTCYVTEYLTDPTHRYCLFVKTKETQTPEQYEYVYFYDKNEIVTLMNVVLRSIQKQKDIIFKSNDRSFYIIGFTSNISKVMVEGKIFSMSKQIAEEIIIQFTKE